MPKWQQKAEVTNYQHSIWIPDICQQVYCQQKLIQHHEYQRLKQGDIGLLISVF
jgi:hypothetical protein